MNTNEIVKKAKSAIWPYPDFGHMRPTCAKIRENYNEMAILTAITEATAQLQKELATEQCTTCKLWTDPANVESGTCVWCIAKELKKQNEEAQTTINTLHRLCKSGEQRGFDKAKENFQSQLATIRESALREAIAIIRNQRAGMDNNGLCLAQRNIESLITTPASECECAGTEFAIESFDAKWKFCPCCGKAISTK